MLGRSLPYEGFEVASAADGQADLLAWATKLGGRYMGADRAEEYGKRNGVPGELVMRVRPSRILAQAAIAD